MRHGREIVCEVRLVACPAAIGRLVRGSITDITERKRAERVAAGERRVFEQLTAQRTAGRTCSPRSPP